MLLHRMSLVADPTLRKGSCDGTILSVVWPACTPQSRSSSARTDPFHRQHLEAYKRQMLPIWSPVRHIVAPRATNQIHQRANLPVAHVQNSQRNILVCRLPFHVLVVAHNHNRLPIRRWMWSPVVEVVRRHLLRAASIWPHSPHLHQSAGALRVEIDPLPIGRVVRV